ncbi:hypothetical protein [Streptomyces sp. NPDC057381]|uniref:hypothetical protein n=1 Tax=Streptomyces sp. NPDC057381 TaxID=3346111 RepID=UPI00363D11EB
MLLRTRTTERYARAVAAAVTAVACLLLAANAGPAGTAHAPVPATEQDTAPLTDVVPDSVTDSVVTVGR